MNKIKKNHIYTDKEKQICPECGGKGETVNENHYIADTSLRNRYVVCRRCFGIGKIPKEIFDDKL